MTDSFQHSVQDDLFLIRAALGRPLLPAYDVALTRIQEQLELCEQSRNLLTTEVHGLLEQLETAREAVQACYDDLQRYAPPHWRNQGKGEILARNFLTSNPAPKPPLSSPLHQPPPGGWPS